MPHQFHTIEAFVQLLEQRAAEQLALEQDAPNDYIQGIHRGSYSVFQRIAATVRDSNIGIVYPPLEQERDDKCDLEPGEEHCPCCEGTGLAGERESCQVCGGIGIVYPPPEVARDIKCNRADSVCTGGENCKRIGMCYSIERDDDGLPWVVEPNVTRCPDCGIVYPPAERSERAKEIARRLRDVSKALNFAEEASAHKLCLMQDDLYEAADLLDRIP